MPLTTVECERLKQVMKDPSIDPLDVNSYNCRIKDCKEPAKFNIDGKKLCRLHTGYYLLNKPPEDEGINLGGWKKPVAVVFSIGFGLLAFVVLLIAME